MSNCNPGLDQILKLLQPAPPSLKDLICTLSNLLKMLCEKLSAEDFKTLLCAIQRLLELLCQNMQVSK